MQWGLLVAYPVLAHAAALSHLVFLDAAALLALALGCLWPALRRGSAGAYAGLLGAAAGIAALHAVDGLGLALYAPPMLLQGAILMVFAQSLRPGAEPLVTRIARAERGTLNDELLAYTRAVTWLWTATLAVLLAVTLGLTASGLREAWSWWTNFLSYAAVAGVFAAEYGYRRLRFRNLDHPGLLTHLKSVARQRVRPG